MPVEHSITTWLAELKNGNPDAVGPLWQRYFAQLVELARKHLQTRYSRVANEEDVALSAFDTFCRRVREGRFPDLGNRDSLWRLLFDITVKKAKNVAASERRQKRGGGAVQGESAFHPANPSTARAAGVNEPVSREPDPQFAAEVAEEYQRLLAQLGDDRLCQIALLAMEGYKNAEIAKHFACGLRTVERKLERIREIWKTEMSR